LHSIALRDRPMNRVLSLAEKGGRCEMMFLKGEKKIMNSIGILCIFGLILLHVVKASGKEEQNENGDMPRDERAGGRFMDREDRGGGRFNSMVRDNRGGGRFNSMLREDRGGGRFNSMIRDERGGGRVSGMIRDERGGGRVSGMIRDERAGGRVNNMIRDERGGGRVSNLMARDERAGFSRGISKNVGDSGNTNAWRNRNYGLGRIGRSSTDESMPTTQEDEVKGQEKEKKAYTGFRPRD